MVYTPLSPFSHRTSYPTSIPNRMDLYPFQRDKVTYTLYLDSITLIIINGRNRAKTLTGSDPHKIAIPIIKFQFENALQTSSDFQIVSLEYFREISFHYPSNKLWNFLKILNLLSLTLSHHDLYLSSVQSLSRVQLFATPWITARHYFVQIEKRKLHIVYSVRKVFTFLFVPFVKCQPLRTGETVVNNSEPILFLGE